MMLGSEKRKEEKGIMSMKDIEKKVIEETRNRKRKNCYVIEKTKQGKKEKEKDREKVNKKIKTKL